MEAGFTGSTRIMWLALITMRSGACHSVPRRIRMFFTSLGLLVDLLLDVINVGEDRKWRAQALHLAVINLIVVEQNGLVRGIKFYRARSTCGPKSERFALR